MTYSFVSAPPRESVYVVSSVYGSLMGPVNFSRVRLWVLLNDGSVDMPFARICRNHPETGMPLYSDLGMVTHVTSAPKRLELTMTDGAEYTLVEAPCVCGAGATGMAGPTDGRHEIVPVRTDILPWLTTI